MMASVSGHTFASRAKWLLGQNALWAGLVLFGGRTEFPLMSGVCGRPIARKGLVLHPES
jgi:hypothetical protein